MNFPVFSQLAGNFGFPETGWLETASSSGESANHHHDRLIVEVAAQISDRLRAAEIQFAVRVLTVSLYSD